MLKRIRLSAEAKLIKAAQTKARRENTTLNAEFRRWLAEYTAAERYASLMEEMQHVAAGGPFSRDEMNRR